jgi:hypothetical protein
MNNKVKDIFKIESIDKPLYKYGLIHKIDLNNYFNSDKERKIQKYKSFALCLLFIFSAFHYSLCLSNYKNKRVPNHYFDLIQYYGGITEYYYVNGIIGSVLSFSIVFIFNYSRNRDYEWLKIIKALKGLTRINSIAIKDKTYLSKYFQKIKFIEKFLSIGTKFNIINVIVVGVALLIMNFNSIDILKYGIISLLLYCLFCIPLLIVSFYGFFYYFIICYYFRMRFKSLKLLIINLSKVSQFRYNTFREIIKQHNNICKDTKNCNRFWSKYYFALTFTIIPINLLTLQLIFFEDNALMVLISATIFVILSMFSHFMLNSITALVNAEAGNSFKYLNKIFISKNSILSIRSKIKV